jgi:transcriptional regulator NrdR family protein
MGNPKESRGSRGPACPNCGEVKSKIKDSRNHRRAQTDKWRRRVCTNCEETFTTLETVADPKALGRDRRVLRAVRRLLYNAGV